MTKTSVLSTLISQADFNMSVMKTLLALSEVIPDDTAKLAVIASFKELSVKNSEVLRLVQIALEEHKPGGKDGS